METRIEVTQVLGQLKIARPATEIEQLVGFRAMAPVRNVVHQQKPLQIAAQPRRNQFFFHQVHGRDDAHREGAGHKCAHQGKSNDDPLGKTLPELHYTSASR
ncbi:hypothetical protein D3C87_1165350 [compost metagenome]